MRINGCLADALGKNCFPIVWETEVFSKLCSRSSFVEFEVRMKSEAVGADNKGLDGR
jgi:hypothetical protein